jgi:nucleotide-binding universal stress UspA family protein
MTNARKLLVPVDFDGPIEPKLRLAATLARRFGAEVTLLHADESGRDANARATMEHAATAALAGVRTRYAVVAGAAARAIVDVARSEKSDLVVLFPHAPINSATNEVLLEAECDVLCVPPTASHDLAIRAIACGADFTANDMVVAPRAAEIARCLEAKLTLVHVTPSVRRYGPGGVHDVPELRDAFFSAARERFREVVRDARGVADAETFVCSADDVAAGLNQAALATHAGLVVIGRRPSLGESGGNCILVATRSTVPVLTVTT